MTKKERDIINKEFNAKKVTPIVCVSGQKMTFKQYQKWDKKTPPHTVVYEMEEKKEFSSEGLDLGILSPDSLFEVDLWYMRNHNGFDLSLRNSRRGH